MFDIKSEFEQYTGKTIDINESIDQVQNEAYAKGQGIDNKYIKQFKKTSANKTRSISTEPYGSPNAPNLISHTQPWKRIFNLT